MSAMVMMTEPGRLVEPGTTVSPCSALSWIRVPSIGDRMVVLARSSSVRWSADRYWSTACCCASISTIAVSSASWAASSASWLTSPSAISSLVRRMLRLSVGELDLLAPDRDLGLTDGRLAPGCGPPRRGHVRSRGGAGRPWTSWPSTTGRLMISPTTLAEIATRFSGSDLSGRLDSRGNGAELRRLDLDLGAARTRIPQARPHHQGESHKHTDHNQGFFSFFPSIPEAHLSESIRERFYLGRTPS